MATKRVSYPVELKAIGDSNGSAGHVEAIVSIFGSVDLVGDRVMPGAFEKSIKEWKASGDPIPVVFSHDWDDPWSHIGQVDELEETAKGLRAVYTLDIADNPVAAQVYKLLKRRTLKDHSFAYGVGNERTARDGANELLELEIIELGPTFKGAHPDTELVAVKAALEAQGKAEIEPEHVEADGQKAGRRLSQATQVELSSIRSDAGNLVARIDSLLGTAEDTEKTADAHDASATSVPIEDPDTKSVDHEPEGRSTDAESLALRSLIEEMSATQKETSGNNST